jgi:streptomycin 6-kinase
MTCPARGTLPVMFSDYLERWMLTPDGAPIVTPTSKLLPVRRDAIPAMLKVAVHAEERRGGLLMTRWNGEGVARVLAHEGDAILMERAQGGTSLAELSRHGRDDDASRIICATVARLHAPRSSLPQDLVEDLVPLTRWFEALDPAANAHGGILRLCATTASGLLATQQDVLVLHGDIHHGNILDFGPRGWLAIDPKGLTGERAFDYANIFCNPDLETATSPGRLARRAEVVAEAAALDRGRLLQWIVAWAGLSAAFSIEDGASPKGGLAVAELAAAELSS